MSYALSVGIEVTFLHTTRRAACLCNNLNDLKRNPNSLYTLYNTFMVVYQSSGSSVHYLLSCQPRVTVT